MAARYLRRHGFKVLYRNYRAPGGGEVDLVCRDCAENILAFVEVKTRRRADFARPAAAVNRAKQALILRGARAWLRLLDNPAVIYRFDVVEVVIGEGTPQICLIKNAFTARGWR